MDFPVPIRSVTSTMDSTTPLYVDTNIVYHIDETKFMGLQESSHASEPALIVDCNSTWNSNNTCEELTGNTSITTEAENQDLYNLIESLDVEDTVLFPVDAAVNIWDLQEMPLEQSTVEVEVHKINHMVYTSVLDVHTPNVNNSPVDCQFPNLLTSNTDYSIDIYESQCTRCEEYHQMPTCRYTNPLIAMKTAKRKRHMSSANQGDLISSFQTEVKISSKRKKLDLADSCLPTCHYSNEFCLDSFMDDNFSQLSFYQEAEHTSMFNFCENSYKRFV